MTREEAIKRLHKYAKYAYGIWHDGDADIEAIDMAIEALQAEPVKHGEWEADRLLTTNGGGYDVIRCSECKSQFPMERTLFCPNCGAKMDKGELTNSWE